MSLFSCLLLGALSEVEAGDEVEVKDRVEGNGPAQAPPSIIATPVLQDTLARKLGLLEGMSQAGTLLVIYDASLTRVGGQTLDLMVATDSQTPKTQLVVIVAPRLDSIELPVTPSLN
ncbi:hypothetical protein H5410_003239 [Solanum commersonii]|uniref:Uncharacterized protein n=1 Tax=Solanum commersonii TaxID=4109 RepID=A0A9J6B4J7_SOLCO|nr:hypothetical protein H5410_003239 [Solanum commersonii]